MEYTPILNGTKTNSFCPKRGIRQGDPLSPYLFILAMEYLSTQITATINNKAWKPFKLRNQDLNVSHLLFVDYVILFAKADITTTLTIKKIISDFCITSGMEIHLDKSKLGLSLTVPNNIQVQITNTLQITNSLNLGSYLGYPLKPNYSSRDFNQITLRLNKKTPGLEATPPLLCWKMSTHINHP